MNRSIALFVALVTLLAHILAIHNDGQGNFAFPYDQAYVAFRLARNLVLEGQLPWNPGMGAFESYPSALWVAIAALGERLSLTFSAKIFSVDLFCQTLGVLSTLFTVILVAQFHSGRAASLIAPVMLAASGCIAAAAANGMETALLTFLVTASFWSFERHHSWRMALALSLCCLTRPEGVLIAIVLLSLRALQRDHRVDDRQAAISPWAFALPLFVFVAAALIRLKTTGFILPPSFAAWLHPEPGQIQSGALYLRDCALISVTPVLVVFPLIFLFRGRLSGAGSRALVLAFAWSVLVMLQGRSPLPFAEACVPVLPLLFVAIQEGMIEALDAWSKSTRLFNFARKLCYGLLLACLVGSALASKEPGKLGPITTEAWHGEWIASSGSARFGYKQPLGRLGLEEEIENTNRLRALGLFMRDNFAPYHNCLTPWPASMGYLSRLQVFDLLGRTNPTRDSDRPQPWTRRGRADVVAALELRPDYVVPRLAPEISTPSMREVALDWMQELDSLAGQAGRLEAIQNAFLKYELIAVPVRGYHRGTMPLHTQQFFLLRNRGLELQPKLELHAEGAAIKIDVRHQSHEQLVDLRVTALDDHGRSWFVRPTGELVPDEPVHARSAILLYNTPRTIELMRVVLPALPSPSKWKELRAVLRNPHCAGEHPFATVSKEAVLAL